MYTNINILIILLISQLTSGVNEHEYNNNSMSSNSEIRDILRRAHPFLKTLNLTNNMLQFLNDVSKEKKSRAVPTEATTTNRPVSSLATISTPGIYLIQKELIRYISKALNNQLVSRLNATTPMSLDVRKSQKRQMPFQAIEGTTSNYFPIPTLSPPITKGPDSSPLSLFTSVFTALPNFNVSLNINLDNLTKRYTPVYPEDDKLRLATPILPATPNIGEMISLAAQLALSTPTTVNPSQLIENLNLAELLKIPNPKKDSFGQVGGSDDWKFAKTNSLPMGKLSSGKKADKARLADEEMQRIKNEAAKLNEAFRVIEEAFKSTTARTVMPTSTKRNQNSIDTTATVNQDDFEGATSKSNSFGGTAELTMQSFEIITERSAGEAGKPCSESCGDEENPTTDLFVFNSPSATSSSSELSAPVCDVHLTPHFNDVSTESPSSGKKSDENEGQKIDPSSSKNINKQALVEIHEEINEIKREKFQGKKEGMPCSLQGGWVSDAAGVTFTINKEQSAEFVVNIEQANGKFGFFRTLDWEVTAFMPFRKTSFLIVTAIHQKDLSMASFSGECRICEGDELIRGHWLLSKSEAQCEDLTEAQEFFGDLWKRKN